MRNEAISALWQAVLDGFCTLNRIQFAAPWRPRQSGC